MKEMPRPQCYRCDSWVAWAWQYQSDGRCAGWSSYASTWGSCRPVLGWQQTGTCGEVALFAPRGATLPHSCSPGQHNTPTTHHCFPDSRSKSWIRTSEKHKTEQKICHLGKIPIWCLDTVTVNCFFQYTIRPLCLHTVWLLVILHQHT